MLKWLDAQNSIKLLNRAQYTTNNDETAAEVDARLCSACICGSLQDGGIKLHHCNGVKAAQFWWQLSASRTRFYLFRFYLTHAECDIEHNVY